MVKNKPPTLDAVFGALSDSTRRAMLSAVAAREQAISELAKPFDISLPAALKHVHVLEEAGLVSTHKLGRVRVCRFESKTLTEAQQWIERHTQYWNKQLDSLEKFLKSSNAR